MFAFIAELIDLACAEIEVEMEEIDEVEIDCGLAIWSVLIPALSCEVFFRIDTDGKPCAYHTNWYDEGFP